MSSVQKFYANKCVLITGASGTVGKIATEKLLRSCPDVRLVYVLMRGKAGKTPKERLEEFFKSPVFLGLQNANSSVLNKVVLVEGDVSQHNLGLNTVMYSVLTNQVNVVLHIAANIKHNLPLLESIEANYLGTKRILDLCLEMKKIDAFVHVSTVGVYLDLKHLEEKADNYFIDPDKIKKSLDGKTGRELRELEEEISGGPGMSYIFTKTAAETLVKGYADKFPVAVIRLPAVGGCLNEPEPGFMDSRISVASFLLSCGSGLLPCLMLDGKANSNIVPADLCANAVLAVAWDVATQRPTTTKYFNCVARDAITMKEVFDYAKKSAVKNPHKDLTWYPGTVCIRNPYLYMLYFMFFVILPAQILDFLSMIQMKKPEFTQDLFMKHKRMSLFWGYRSRSFGRNNMIQLHKKMSFQDQQLFPTGEEYFDWSSYMDAYHRSLKKYVLKISPADTEACQVALRRSYWRNWFRITCFPLMFILFTWILFH